MEGWHFKKINIFEGYLNISLDSSTHFTVNLGLYGNDKCYRVKSISGSDIKEQDITPDEKIYFESKRYKNRKFVLINNKNGVLDIKEVIIKNLYESNYFDRPFPINALSQDVEKEIGISVEDIIEENKPNKLYYLDNNVIVTWCWSNHNNIKSRSVTITYFK